MEHVSVLKEEVYEYLSLEDGDIVVDGTLGLGGHAAGMLELVGEKGELIGFDLDEENLQEAKKRLSRHKNTIFIQDNFRYLKTRVEEALGKDAKVDAILLDLGLSSPHVDEADRGFSFKNEGPLDMRFSKSQELTAYDVINGYSEEKMADIFYQYGEEVQSRKLARKIVERRRVTKFETTVELADFISDSMPVRYGKKGKGKRSKVSKNHPATKVFQALRIEVNDELNALKEALQGSIDILSKGGRLVIISYHSLEDRIVKHFFKELARTCVCPQEQLQCTCRGEALVEILTKKPVGPMDKELGDNPRARSAKLRAMKKLFT
ncbi:16S rRNA (cytosine(1402)-N(4))-methyltransferase RsmH [Candidatus Peregrinibacteria bacterium]|jgi:16S rRNA (cytosine1402-N4)-methyltransferase|nr:16S rRNA (cytosine(1402)-N(4))-methyltransferase RsmH [Candidatus Peregrinibacteria bacterium]MBT4055927.1 16S rRNA (cytosine(1402)-N(4))-methyltransferase RsmH [Candidatus Peregrinibacteria bacterium]